MKTLFFILSIIISTSGYTCGPYGGSSISYISNGRNTIADGQVFFFSTNHYDNKYKNYGQHYYLALEDTLTKKTIKLVQSRNTLKNLPKNQYLALVATQELRPEGAYRFVLNLEDNKKNNFMDRVYFFGGHKIHKVKNQTVTTVNFNLDKTNYYKDKPLSYVFTSSARPESILLVEITGKNGDVTKFLTEAQKMVSVYVGNKDDQDFTIKITQFGQGGDKIKTQSFESEWLKTDNTGANT